MIRKQHADFASLQFVAIIEIYVLMLTQKSIRKMQRHVLVEELFLMLDVREKQKIRA